MSMAPAAGSIRDFTRSTSDWGVLEEQIPRMLTDSANLLQTTRLVLKLDTVAWAKGPFAVPQWLKVTLDREGELITKIRFMRSMVNRFPSLTGRYGGTIYRQILRSMKNEFNAILGRIECLTDGLKLAISRTNSAYEDIYAVQRAVRDLKESRSLLLAKLHTLRHVILCNWIETNDNHLVLSVDPTPYIDSLNSSSSSSSFDPLSPPSPTNTDEGSLSDSGMESDTSVEGETDALIAKISRHGARRTSIDLSEGADGVPRFALLNADDTIRFFSFFHSFAVTVDCFEEIAYLYLRSSGDRNARSCM
eukprot:TRINITY_DN9622_c0_g2_i1.p1 TRINITY_DN9622_c0_g2~~TRINITY_DN9622_c0_g2_i1.p1  ORF type:complete len:306 (+),score=115.50 TRINITY_DN9622_c0_g2_i1:2-919(+)